MVDWLDSIIFEKMPPGNDSKPLDKIDKQFNFFVKKNLPGCSYKITLLDVKFSRPKLTEHWKLPLLM